MTDENMFNSLLILLMGVAEKYLPHQCYSSMVDYSKPCVTGYSKLLINLASFSAPRICSILFF